MRASIGPIDDMHPPANPKTVIVAVHFNNSIFVKWLKDGAAQGTRAGSNSHNKCRFSDATASPAPKHAIVIAVIIQRGYRFRSVVRSMIL